MSEKLKEVSIVFLRQEDKILLAMKKRGFGVGRWNGVGGKLDPGEVIEQTAIRECQEEIVVSPKKLAKVAIINFYFPPDKAALGFDQQAHVFLCDNWDGDPEETEEMKPQWFSTRSMPYESMWPGDKYWLPLVIKGRKIEADFQFNDDDDVIDHEIRDMEVDD
jgi:ADP-ribose pyrophosphatase YjhB (NUDIX family)